MSDDLMMTSPMDTASAPTTTDADREILAALEIQLKKLRPIFAEEGGDTRVVGVNNGVARLEFLSGGCEGCGGGISSLGGGLRLMLLERIPGLKDVVFTS